MLLFLTSLLFSSSAPLFDDFRPYFFWVGILWTIYIALLKSCNCSSLAIDCTITLQSSFGISFTTHISMFLYLEYCSLLYKWVDKSSIFFTRPTFSFFAFSTSLVCFRSPFTVSNWFDSKLTDFFYFVYFCFHFLHSLHSCIHCFVANFLVFISVKSLVHSNDTSHEHNREFIFNLNLHTNEMRISSTTKSEHK